MPTVFENYVANVLTPNHKLIELALWDTAGQEEYDRLRPLSYPDVDVILICFSLDNLISLQNVKDIWFPEVNHFCPGIPILLVGTKYDVMNDSIDRDLAIQLAYDINAIGYIQCSAKTMFNIKNVFNFAINHFHKTSEPKKRMSFMGHLRDKSRGSVNSRGHKKQSSIDSAVFSSPLTDEPQNPYTTDYERNPYTSEGQYENRYEDEFAFTRREKKRRCTIL